MINKASLTRYALTGGVVLAAGIAVAVKYSEYIRNPWTRDGQVRANVVQVAPRVSGPIVELTVKDNQFVRAGDLLFRIDPRTYRLALDLASAKLDETRNRLNELEQEVRAADATVAQAQSEIPEVDSVVASAEATLEKAEADFERASDLVAINAVSQRAFESTKAAVDVAEADLARARAQRAQAHAALLRARAELAGAKAELGAPGEDNALLRGSKAALENATLNLEFTEVRASVDGYVTNLNLRLGSQAVANQPALALVDVASFWVHGFFRENAIAEVRPGDRAIVTLMTYPDRPLEGRVDSIGWGISQSDGSTGHDLLPNVSPTFQWIRLAQRIPVRVHFERVPEDVSLRVGTTASVLVITGSDDEDDSSVPGLPKVLQ